MKKLIVAGSGIMMVALMALPAAAGNWSGYHANNYRATHEKVVRKQPVRVMKRVDRSWAAKRIHQNRMADRRVYKHDVRELRKHHYQQSRRQHKPIYKQYKNGYEQRRHYNSALSYLSFGFWF